MHDEHTCARQTHGSLAPSEGSQPERPHKPLRLHRKQFYTSYSQYCHIMIWQCGNMAMHIMRAKGGGQRSGGSQHEINEFEIWDGIWDSERCPTSRNGNMTIWQYGNLWVSRGVKRQYGNMAIWQYGNLRVSRGVKRQYGNMAIWQSVGVPGCETAIWQYGNLWVSRGMKRQYGNMAI